MYTIKVLKRRAAASVIAAIWIAMALTQALYQPIFQLSNKLSQIGAEKQNDYYGPNLGWRYAYLNPFISLVLELVVLEVLIRLFVWIHPLFVRKRK